MAKKEVKKTVKKTTQKKKKPTKYDEKFIIKGDLDSILRASFKE